MPNYPTPPKRSRSVSTKRQKTYTRKGAKAASASGALMYPRVPRGIPIGCPQSMRVRLIYNTSVVLSAPLGGAITYATFRANGPFDPLAAVGGNQPRYYDQWSALYNSVTTTRAKAVVQYANEEVNSASTFMNQHVGIAHTSQVTLPGTLFEDALELNYNQHKIAAGNNPVTVAVVWKPEQYFIGKTIYDEDIASDVASTPVRECFFHIYTCATVSGAAIAAHTFNLRIEYDVIFFDKRYPTQS